MTDNSLDIITKYYNVAKTGTSPSLLVKDKMMLTFIAYSLSSSDASLQIIDLALETLCLLATNDCNITRLSETFGVVEAVYFITSREDVPESLREKALQLHKKLSCTGGPAYCTRSRTKTQQLHLNSAKIIKIITFHVHGLSKENRESLKLAVSELRGVVSVEIDDDHQRCKLFLFKNLTAFNIANAIFEKTNMQAQLVIQNSFGQEVLKPLLESSITNCEVDLPPYLNENDSPIRDKAVSQLFLMKNKTSNWLSSAVGFFQKSFYW